MQRSILALIYILACLLLVQPAFAAGTFSVHARGSQFTSDSGGCAKAYPSSTGYSETVVRCTNGGGDGEWAIPATFPPDSPLDWDMRINYRTPNGGTGKCQWYVDVIVEHDGGDLNAEGGGTAINTSDQAHSSTTTYYSILKTNFTDIYENDTPATCGTLACAQDRPIKFLVNFIDSNSTINCDFMSMDIFY